MKDRNSIIKEMYANLKDMKFTGGEVIKKLSESFDLSESMIKKIVYKKKSRSVGKK
jgi:hypothetical protein